MKILLEKIHPSPNPIRKTWDEEKMVELAQSIKEQGMIVPIKVRPNQDGYEVVYGHRRVEGARRAGLVEIECIVEGVDDTNVLIQSLIENVVREDMTPVDKANALAELIKETGWSQREIERKGIMIHQEVGRYLALLELDDDIKEMVVSAPGGDVPEGKITTMHVRVVGGTKGSNEILKKAAQEGLTSAQTRAVADAVRDAPTEKIKEEVLKGSVSSQETAEDLLRKARIRTTDYSAGDLEKKWKKDDAEEFDYSAKDFLEALRELNVVIERTSLVTNRFSPEAVAFTVRKIEQTIGLLNGLKEKLNGSIG